VGRGGEGRKVSENTKEWDIRLLTFNGRKSTKEHASWLQLCPRKIISSELRLGVDDRGGVATALKAMMGTMDVGVAGKVIGVCKSELVIGNEWDL
jgi:hypothetical protein